MWHMCVAPGVVKQAARQACGQGENSSADGSRGRSAIKRVGGGYAHTPSQPTKASLDASARSSSEATPQEDLPRQSLLPPASSEADATAVQGLAADLTQMRIGDGLDGQGITTPADTAAVDAGPGVDPSGGLQGFGAVSSPGSRPEDAASQPVQRGTPHGYVPSAHKTAVLRREELVLGSPSTRASTPQSRTQVGLGRLPQRNTAE